MLATATIVAVDAAAAVIVLTYAVRAAGKGGAWLVAAVAFTALALVLLGTAVLRAGARIALVWKGEE